MGLRQMSIDAATISFGTYFGSLAIDIRRLEQSDFIILESVKNQGIY